MKSAPSRWLRTLACLLAGLAGVGSAQSPHGPYNAHFLAGGSGLLKSFPVWNDGDLRKAGAPWTLQGWIKADEINPALTLVAGFGSLTEAGGRMLALDHGHPVLLAQGKILLGSTALLPAGQWIWLGASFDGAREQLWLGGQVIATAKAAGGGASPILPLGWRDAGSVGFAGRIAGLSLSETALSDDQARQFAAQPPKDDLIAFEEASPDWPVQLKQMLGQAAPQDAWTLPRSKGQISAPRVKTTLPTPGLTEDGPNRWRLGGFMLQAAPRVEADGASLSRPGYLATEWLAATVPGTVLTTMVDRGVYPDPDFGLNNLAIPERLSQQNYWYRSEFTAPADLAGKQLNLIFKGINYAAAVWLNGEKLGTIRGAFTRGQFEVAGKLRPGQINALAIEIAPPPHPGIAHEQSISAGVGENGGMQALDGPTFIASEGWDWIPSVRDRNSGLWQDVMLDASGLVRLGEPQVITTLAKPDRSLAELTLLVPLHNSADHPVTALLGAEFDDVFVEKTALLPPGDSEIALRPSEFPQLRIKNPRLWWPNGLGAATLHELHLTARLDGRSSDSKVVRFGLREISYELSLLDPSGHLRRVEVDPSLDPGVALIDGSHQGIRKIAGGWVASLTMAGLRSKAVKTLPETSLAPYLVLRVNGVRVPARGGSWGTDDWRKRVSRERLEPFFRLHKNAHINIIRNWVGQNTEDVFYDLADEYGLLVLNDFWESTQDYNIEAEDVPLFLANAADVIGRYRRHPSIALWFGRNEGVPQPVLNEGLARLVRELDGTRGYMGSSNRVNLQDSGPYDYREAASYFTTFSKGFAVEVGAPSFPTLEAFQAALAPEDWWPLNDVWAYHDWHQSGNGATEKFMRALDRKFGAATSLEDFERKAQMLNYESHRAIFEGMNAELWTKNSGRMLWMTQPAWPSTNWQILSSDYDTHGSYYGVQKAAEPLHIQLDLPDYRLTAVNNTQAMVRAAQVTEEIYALDGSRLGGSDQRAELPADAVVALPGFDLAPLWRSNKVLLIHLRLTEASGRVLSENFYWQSAHDEDLRALSDLPPQPVALSARSRAEGADLVVSVTLLNKGDKAALLNKITLIQGDGSRVLPAYASDNYLSLLPGESRTVEVTAPVRAVEGEMKVALRGWDVRPAETTVAP